GRRAVAGGSRPDHGLPGRHGEVEDLSREGAAAGAPQGLRRLGSENMATDIGGNEPDEITRLLRDRLPRHQAPTHLRTSLAGTFRRSEVRTPPWLWLTPALSALATALGMGPSL